MRKLLFALLLIASLIYAAPPGGVGNRTYFSKQVRVAAMLWVDDSTLMMTKGADTTLLYWRNGDFHIESTADSLLFNQWGTNTALLTNLSSSGSSASGPDHSIQFRSGSSLAGSLNARIDSLDAGRVQLNISGQLNIVDSADVGTIFHSFADGGYAHFLMGDVDNIKNSTTIEINDQSKTITFAEAADGVLFQIDSTQIRASTVHPDSNYIQLTSDAKGVYTVRLSDSADGSPGVMTFSADNGFNILYDNLTFECDPAQTHVHNDLLVSGLTGSGNVGSDINGKLVKREKIFAAFITDGGVAVFDSIVTNDFGGSPVLNEPSDGIYSVTITGAFTGTHRTADFTGSWWDAANANMYIINGLRTDDDTYTFYVTRDLINLRSDAITHVYIEIKVWQ